MIEQVRSRDGEAPIRTLTKQHGQTAARGIDGTIGLLLLLFGTRHLRIGQVSLLRRTQAALNQPAGQRERFTGALLFGIGHIPLGKCIAQPHIGTRHVHRQLDARRVRIDLHCTTAPQRSFPGIAFAAPEIQIPRESRRHRLGPGEGSQRIFGIDRILAGEPRSYGAGA